MCRCDTADWCFEDRRKSRRCVCVWAFLSFLSSGAVVYFAIVMHGSKTIRMVEEEIEYLRVE